MTASSSAKLRLRFQTSAFTQDKTEMSDTAASIEIIQIWNISAFVFIAET